MSTKIAQTFYIDKAIVSNSDHVTIDSIDVYFKNKPQATANRSGITNPGATLFITQVNNDIPDLTVTLTAGTSRKEYNEIVCSADASIVTKFKFNQPLVLPTNANYAVVVDFDGQEEFDLWTCREGDVLVKTNTISSGASAKNVGMYFEYNYANSGTWKGLSNQDLKFTVYACSFTNAVSNSGPTVINSSYVIPSDPVEYITYNEYHPNTVNSSNLQIGELAFQETPVIYGTVNVNANSTLISSTNNINFSTLFPTPTTAQTTTLSTNPTIGQDQYIVLRNGSTTSANVDVVRILSIVSNTQILLERLPVFTNSTATFSVTAAGVVDNHHQYFYYTGRKFDIVANTWSTQTAQKTSIVHITKSNANSTIRFTNNTVQSITIGSGGTGYSNADVVTVYPILNANTANAQHIAYIPEYSNAVANVVTNGAGTITGLAITNAGWGLAALAGISITTANGASANLTASIGSVIRGAESNARLADTVVTGIPVNMTNPHMSVNTNQNQNLTLVQHLPYYFYPGYEHIVKQSNTAFSRTVVQYKNEDIIDTGHNDGRVVVLPSHSIVQRSGSNVSIVLANSAVQATSVVSPSIVEMSYSSNNSYTIPAVSHSQVYYYSYIINNDITGETKGHGNAKARHVSEKVTFDTNRDAEDIVVYCDVYRPVGTNVYAYARLHNRSDQESFDDKDWTLLQLTSDNSTYYSSLTNEDDITEFTFSLPRCPASVNTITGYATTTLSQSNVVGIGTSWSTDLQINDVVKVYSELFPTNYMISVVRLVANNTSIMLDDAVTDSNLTGSNFKIDLLGRPANSTAAEIGSPFQAFTYKPNSYVCRYYDSSMAKKDTYNTFQVKLVLTSNNQSIVPKVWNTRAVGVSA